MTGTRHDRPTDDRNPARLTRRAFGVGVGVAVVGGALFASRWFNLSASAGEAGTLSADAAHKAVLSGQLVLIDIRRPDEWSATGVGEGAIPLDMRRDDFIEALLGETGGRTDAQVALICARGVRSRGMTARLTAAGFSNIIDIPEGMLGSGAGVGWIRQGLPTVAWQAD